MRSRSTSREDSRTKVRRSASLSSSTSVSTISTKASESPPQAREKSPEEDAYQNARRMSGSMPSINRHRTTSSDRSRSPPRFDNASSRTRIRSVSPKRRNRQGLSSDEEPNANLGRGHTRRDRSDRSEGRRHRGLTQRDPSWERDSSHHHGIEQHRKGAAQRRERSLSPFSRRLALTQAMNAGR